MDSRSAASTATGGGTPITVARSRVLVASVETDITIRLATLAL